MAVRCRCPVITTRSSTSVRPWFPLGALAAAAPWLPFAPRRLQLSRAGDSGYLDLRGQQECVLPPRQLFSPRNLLPNVTTEVLRSRPIVAYFPRPGSGWNRLTTPATVRYFFAAALRQQRDDNRPEKGDGHHLCKAPFGPFRQMVPVTFFRDDNRRATAGRRPSPGPGRPPSTCCSY